MANQEKSTYEKPVLVKHSQLKEVTLASTSSGKGGGKGKGNGNGNNG